MRNNIKKVLPFVSILWAGATVAIAGCFVNGNSDCPKSLSTSYGNCTLVSGTEYPEPKTAPGGTGLDNYYSDGTPHCHYFCDDGTQHDWYPGGLTTGNPCNTGGGTGSTGSTGT